MLTDNVFHYDHCATDVKLRVVDRVMVYQPGEVQGKAWKLKHPFFDHYKIVSLTPNNAKVVLVD